MGKVPPSTEIGPLSRFNRVLGFETKCLEKSAKIGKNSSADRRKRTRTIFPNPKDFYFGTPRGPKLMGGIGFCSLTFFTASPIS